MPFATGSDELELSCIAYILRRADIEVVVAKADADGSLQKGSKGSTGVTIEADELLDEELLERGFDAVVMPGGGKGSTIMGGNPLLVSLVKKFLADETKLVGSICANPANFLQANGLLEGYDKVTCYPTLADKIEKSKYVSSQSVVRCKNLITAPSPGTAMEFAVALVEAIKGKEEADKVADTLVLKAGSNFYKQANNGQAK